MNPFFEQRWRDAHTRLITHICEALQDQLPQDLVSVTEEAVVSIGTNEPHFHARPDIHVREARSQSAAVSGGQSEHPGVLLATEPLYVLADDQVERWVEINDGCD